MLFRVSIIELLGALSIACVINCVIVGVFAGSPNCSVGSFAQAYCWLGKCGGAAAASIFAATLIAAGLSSAAVGTLSGQIVMDDLTDFKLSLPLRRALVALPTLLAIGCGCDSSMLIINSQVFLCFCLPFVLAPLIHLSFSKAVIPRSRLPLHWGILSSIVCIVVVAINTGMVINAATGMTKSWQPPSRLDGGHTVAMHP
jgi:manganese transport protein